MKTKQARHHLYHLAHRLTFSAILVFAVVLGFSFPVAHAAPHTAVLSDNLSQAYLDVAYVATVSTDGNPYWAAQSFTTQSSDYVITSVALRLSKTSGTSGTYAVQIYTVSGGKPGTKVADVAANANAGTLSDFTPGSSSPIVSFTGLSIALSPSTSYYLVVRPMTLSGMVTWDYTNSTSGIGFPSNFSGSQNNGVTWSDPATDMPQQMQIVADVPPCISTGSTAWSSSGTWSCGHVPNGTEQVTISTGHTVLLTGNVTQNSALTLNGDVNTTASYVLTLGSSASVTGAGDVIGTVRRTNPGTGSALQFNNRYTTINFATAPTQMDLKLTKSAPSGLDRAIGRYYTLTPTGSVSATIQLAYLAGEVPGAPFNEVNNALWRYNGSRWVLQGGMVNTTNHYVSLAGVDTFSDWALSDSGSPTAVTLASFKANAPSFDLGAWLRSWFNR
ncbi:MAG: hypothetical protein HZB51_21320 [Chloroflexi bacterium]|nr:hypothetical protein [Chloroflexota bacterium]